MKCEFTIINVYKTLTSVPSRRREWEGGVAKTQYNKKWQDAMKNGKKGGGSTAPERASSNI